MTSRKLAVRALATTLVVSALALTGCSSKSKASSAPTGSIKLGGIYTNTPFAFGADAQKIAQEVFNETNAAGGIQGRKIDFMSGDDGEQPTTAAQLARKYVGAGAVAMVGSASFIDCGTNAGYYKKQNIFSIEAIGADPFCFNSPNIAPVNLGPFSSITADLYYASKFLNSKKICLFQPATPGTSAAVAAAVQRWTTITGQKLLIDDHNLPQNQTDLSPELLRAKTAGCDAFFYGGGDAVAASILKNAKNQGMQDVNFLFVAVAYTTQLAKTAGGLGMNVYLASEFNPFTLTDDANAAWRQTATKAGANQTSFAQGGYVAASWLVSVLKSIKGPITRASVSAALAAGGTYQSPMVGSPLTFGTGNAHAPNQAVKMVSLKNGSWQVVNNQYFTLPTS
ncbi:MAG: ABC transporter substrate-binding protein [Actinomycetota bacterium]|nr:ABC transporter substrate-binding protein [Actinomycetota bacterium]MDQ2955755.1 ABC transporter substrate-binding protein [Actinomycetota bacterium]